MANKTPKFKVDGTSHTRAEEAGKPYAVWRVLGIADDNFITAFYGPASFTAASVFCAYINDSEEWNP